MNTRDPVRSMSFALMKALERDLSGLESSLANDLFGSESGARLKARPRVDQCQVVLFSQAWSARDLGYRSCDGAATVETETVVVTGPAGDACVYASTQLLYRVEAPNRRFFLDVMGQRMRGVGEHVIYEGRDSADLEAVSYEASSAFARICGAASRLGKDEAGRAARVLSEMAGRLAEVDSVDVHTSAG